MKTQILVCAVALAFASCRTDTAGKEEPTPAPSAPSSASPGKPQAPVAIDAELSAGSVQLRLRFDAAARDVEVRVNGVDGLGLSGTPVLASGRTFASGETATFNVPILPGPGQGMLAVHVSGTFPGGQRIAVRAFAIGTPSADQLRKAQDGTTTIGGEPVKLMPLAPPKQ
jgi:hypothetical protein